MKKVRYICEAVALYAVLMVFAILPINIASAIGGYIAQMIGMCLKKRNRIALTNLNIAFPQMSVTEKKVVVSKMWNHLGRVFAEMPHWYMMRKKKMYNYIELSEELHCKLQNIISNSKQKVIIVSGHYGNWELCNHVLSLLNIKCAVVYRSLENKYMDFVLRKIRTDKGITLVKKDNGGIKSAIKLFHSGLTLGMLVDQRHIHGEFIPFFERDAQTVMLPAKLAQQNNAPIVMMRVMRVNGVKYRVDFKEIPLDGTPSDIMKRVHHEMEMIIITSPEQWFWIHKRWPQGNYK